MGRCIPVPGQLRRRAMLALLAAATSGCIPGGGPLYVLAPVPGPMLTGAPMTVAVRGVGLPQLMQRVEVVRESELPLPAGPATEWWAEPLDVMIGRVMVQDLIQRLPGTRVFLDLQPPFTPSDTWIDMTVLRFDLDVVGEALVQAQVQVGGLRLLTRSSWKRITPANGSTQALVTALSIALGQVADLVAALVVESWEVPFR